MPDPQPCDRCFATAVVDCLSKDGQTLRICRACFQRAVAAGEVQR